MSNLVDENGNEIGKPEQFDMNLYQNTNETILVNLTDKVAGYEEGFKDGAEYGYNKAFVEADKNLKAIVTDFNKAKEIVKKFLEFVNNEVEFDSEHPQEHTDLWNELCEKAEQFISEMEK